MKHSQWPYHFCILIGVTYAIYLLLLAANASELNVAVLSWLPTMMLSPNADARSIAIALLAVSTSIFVFSPPLVESLKNEIQRKQITQIEKNLLATKNQSKPVINSALLATATGLMTVIFYTKVGLAAQTVTTFIALAYAGSNIMNVLSFQQPNQDLKATINEAATFLTNGLNAIFKRQQDLRQQSISLENKIYALNETLQHVHIDYLEHPTSGTVINIKPQAAQTIFEFNIDSFGESIDRELDIAKANAESTHPPTEKFRLAIINPHQDHLPNKRVPIIEISDTNIGQVPQSLANKLPLLFEENVKEYREIDQEHNYRLTLLKNELVGSALEEELQTFGRILEIFFQATTSILEDSTLSVAEKDIRVRTLLSDYFRSIYSASERILSSQPMRQACLSHLQKIMSESFRKRCCSSFSEASSICRALIFYPDISELTVTSYTRKIQSGDLKYLCLVLHEYTFRFHKQIDEDPKLLETYAVEQIKIFERALDADIRSNSPPKNATSLIKLLERHNVGDMPSSTKRRLRVLLRFSYEAYLLYRMYGSGEDKVAEASINDFFSSNVPASDANELIREFERNDFFEKVWSRWPMWEIDFGGSYTFSTFTWILRILLIRFIRSSDTRWIQALSLDQITKLRDLAKDEAIQLDLFCNTNGPNETSTNLIDKRIEELEQNQTRMIQETPVDPQRCSQLLSAIQSQLENSKHRQIFDNVRVVQQDPAEKPRARVLTSLFSIKFPKEYLFESETPFRPDSFNVGNDIWGSLLSHVLSNLDRRGAIEHLLAFSQSTLGSEIVAVENRLLESDKRANGKLEAYASMAQNHPRVFKAWLNLSPRGVYFLQPDQLSFAPRLRLKSKESAADDGVILRNIRKPWFFLESKVQGDKFIVQFFLSAEIQARPSAVLFLAADENDGLE